MEHYHFRVGRFGCTLIQDGASTRSAASFLPAAPQDELERVIRQHDLDPDALDFSISPLVINTGSAVVLVDTGEGGAESRLPDRLRAQGIDAADIDLIVITHGHWDHIGGILDAAGNFRFPKARYLIASAEWDYWTAPDRFAAGDRNPGIPTWNALKAHPEKIGTVGGGGRAEAEIMPGVCAVAAPGHTVGHIALELSSDGEKLLHIADAAHSYFQVACPQWSAKFDYDKAQAAETRRALFERAARDGSLLSAYHFRFPGVGHIVERDGGLRWEQAP